MANLDCLNNIREFYKELGVRQREKFAECITSSIFSALHEWKDSDWRPVNHYKDTPDGSDYARGMLAGHVFASPDWVDTMGEEDNERIPPGFKQLALFLAVDKEFNKEEYKRALPIEEGVDVHPKKVTVRCFNCSHTWMIPQGVSPASLNEIHRLIANHQTSCI